MKYPYIADKKMYAAVMGACKWIRECGHFNKATQYYADRYGLNVDDVRAEVRKRQGAGQKGKKRDPYKYFVVVIMSQNEAQGQSVVGWKIVKATSEENATKKFSTWPPRGDSAYDSWEYAEAIYEGETVAECEEWVANNPTKIRKVVEEATW